MSLYIYGLSVEYQTFPIFCDLGSHKISTLLDLASLSYRPDTITRSAEKQPTSEAKSEPFDHPSHRFSILAEYQSGTSLNSLSTAKR